MNTIKLSLFGLILSFAASAQSDLLLYNFNAVPQSLHVNPALQQQTRVWVGLPVISGVQFHYHNNAFALIDLVETGTDVNANKDKIILSLDDKSQLAFNQTTELLGIGFRAWKGFVTLGATQQIDYKMGLPGDLLRLVNFGNAGVDNRNLDIGAFGFESLVRTNYYIGYQREYNDKLRIGGRLKFIMGQAHGYVEKMSAKVITTDTSSLLLETDILARSAGVSDIMSGGSLGTSNIFTDNLGFGIDLGASYNLDENWNFSASVLDLGFISWKGNTSQYSSKGTYTYDGIDADLSSDNPVDSWKQIVDSLEAAFEFEEEEGVNYTRGLSSRVFAGVNYNINKKHAFGLLYHGRIWDDRLFSDVSVNYQGKLARGFQLTVGYSIINRTYNNLGAGLSLKLGPLQLYVISDNVLNAIMYENLKTTNVRAGLNITLYDKKDKSKKKRKRETTNQEEEPKS